MSQTLSNGYKKPQTGDRGNSFFKDLEDNIQRTNDHTHNGIDSEKIPSQNILKQTQTISSANWGGSSRPNTSEFVQNITLPSGLTFDLTTMEFRDATIGSSTLGGVIHPFIQKINDTSYIIGLNDDTLDVLVIYG